MARPLNILFASSEVHPFAKTGGLGDVSSALPLALKQQGHDVRVVLPKYRSVGQAKRSIQPMGLTVAVPVGPKVKPGELHESRLNRSVPVYFIGQDGYFDREGLYGDAEGEFPDNAERFIFFSRAVLETCKAINFQPDIIHCNDWQTGLIPCYLKTIFASDPFFKNTRSIFSIHNLGYQGNFDKQYVPVAHLPWNLFTSAKVEFYGFFNFLKAGLVYADKLVTVSKIYSKEILTPEHGFGLDGVLRHYRNKLSGILNGADYGEWDPQTDSNIKTRYGPKSLKGKQECKKSLARKLSLKLTEQTPLLCMVTRLSPQKGIDLMIQRFAELMEQNVALVILGSGDKRYETFFKDQTQNYPKQFRFISGFDEKLAHQIIAGSDLLLMPSLYEPCGLTQMYALRYGTVPMVRRVGGLADTVKAFQPAKNTGTGFLLKPTKASEWIPLIKKALALFPRKKVWKGLMLNGMKQDFSWEKAARDYVRLYRQTLA
ncbi:MAG: glycogen synthase GlgA, partial [Nitrospinota bacterium]|nr:glycogen synthase GlgA [Nitrospinota bacterium]